MNSITSIITSHSAPLYLISLKSYHINPYIHASSAQSLHLHALRLLSLSLLNAEASTLSIMSELLVLFPEPGNDLLVGAPDGLDLEQVIHMLQRNRLRLRNEEEDEGNGEDHERSEEEVHAVLHLEEHLRREARDDEVPEPVVCSGGGLAEGASILHICEYGCEDGR